MWIVERGRKNGIQMSDTSAQQGVVTMSGESASVYLDGERRWIPTYAPGGYCWRPQLGEQVLVMKTGEQGQDSCIVATCPEGQTLAPGEVRISGGGGEIFLADGGTVSVTGTLKINGESLEQMIARMVAAVMPSEGG